MRYIIKIVFFSITLFLLTSCNSTPNKFSNPPVITGEQDWDVTLSANSGVRFIFTVKPNGEFNGNAHWFQKSKNFTNTISGSVSGNTIEFTDHNAQGYKFKWQGTIQPEENTASGKFWPGSLSPSFWTATFRTNRASVSNRSNSSVFESRFGQECVNGKRLVTLDIENAGFEEDILGSPKWWKYGIDKGWAIEFEDRTFANPSQAGAGVYDITFHKSSVVFNPGDSESNVGFLHRGKTGIKQTLNHALKPDATYTLKALVGNRSDIPFGSYRLSLYAGDVLLKKTSQPIPSESEFMNVELTYRSTNNSKGIGRPLRIVMLNTSERHGTRTQVVVDNFELTEESNCSSE